METIEYASKFAEAAKFFTLQGTKLLIERIELGEVKTRGGIIIADNSQVRADLRLQKPHVGLVIAAGQGYYDAETKSYIPMEVQVGNVILLNSIGIQYMQVLPGSPSYTANKVGITTEGDVQMVFKDLEAFNAYVKVMGGSLE